MTYQFPLPEEYPSYYEAYLSTVNNVGDIISHLKIEQDGMVEFIKSIPTEKLDYAYAPSKWTIKEVLIHLIDTERIFCYRALSFARGETTSLPGYNHDIYAQHSFAKERSLESVIQDYTAVRAATIVMFNSFSQTTHQNIGIANDNQITVRTIPFIIAGHERHHKKVIEEKYLEH